MQCPICGAVAENITRGDYEGLSVRCHNCGDFDVVDSVLNKLLRLDGAGRADALEKAKGFARAGARPTISTTCL
jgi:hypothetical protein